MVTLPRVLFHERTRLRIEFERGYKYSHLIMFDAGRVFIRKMPIPEIERSHTTQFLNRPNDPTLLKRTVLMFSDAFSITERAKTKLEEIRMTIDIENADNQTINDACVKLAANLDDKSKLKKLPKNGFKTREESLARYQAIKEELAAAQATASDAKTDDNDADIKAAEPKKARVKKPAAKKAAPTKKGKEDMKAKTKVKARPAPKTKRASTSRNGYDDDTRVKTLVKGDVRGHTRDGKVSRRHKLMMKIHDAGARGLTLAAALKGGGMMADIHSLIFLKKIAVMK